MAPDLDRSRGRALAATTLAVAVVVILPLLLLEGGSRLYLRLNPTTLRVDPWAYLASRPPAYADADYFSKRFVREAMHCLTRASRAGLAFEDYRGRYINVIGGVRQTTNQPKRYTRRVLVYGASAVFSRRVPDARTIPSFLQRVLNARQEQTFLVVNYGLPGITLKQTVARLLYRPVSPGDVVIFYGGIGEIFNPLFILRFRELIAPGDEHGTVQKLNFVQRTLNDLRLTIGDRSAAIQLLADAQLRERSPDRVEDEEELLGILEESATRYRELLVEANRYVAEQGGSFYNFLQPNLFVTDDRSTHEQWLVENELKQLPGFEEAFRLGYPLLREAMESARSDGVVSFDVTDTFRSRPPGSEVYFDYAHVNHVANELMAKRMFKAILGPQAEVARGD